MRSARTETRWCCSGAVHLLCQPLAEIARCTVAAQLLPAGNAAAALLTQVRACYSPLRREYINQTGSNQLIFTPADDTTKWVHMGLLPCMPYALLSRAGGLWQGAHVVLCCAVLPGAAASLPAATHAALQSCFTSALTSR